MLALADRRGIIEGSIPGLADLCRVTVDECREALTKLLSPDPDSRSKEQDGRRITQIDGGWLLVNHAKYRQKLRSDDRREYLTIKQREHRAKIKASTKCQQSEPSQPIAEASSEAEASTKRSRKFIPPSREEVNLLATKSGLPIEQADTFWDFYESKGWMVGKNKMVSVAGAMAGWTRRWRKEQQESKVVSPTTLAILRQKELDEVTTKMRAIRGSYSEHQSWSDDDKIRWYKLKARRDELKKLLGMQV